MPNSSPFLGRSVLFNLAEGLPIARSPYPSDHADEIGFSYVEPDKLGGGYSEAAFVVQALLFKEGNPVALPGDADLWVGIMPPFYKVLASPDMPPTMIHTRHMTDAFAELSDTGRVVTAFEELWLTRNAHGPQSVHQLDDAQCMGIVEGLRASRDHIHVFAKD